MAVTNYLTMNGMIVHENRDGVQRDYVPDTLGSTAALVDDTQTITDRWEYWPYGEVSKRTGTNPTPFTFVGMLGYFRDVLDKLFYVRARHLRVDLARWLTVDPLWPTEYAYLYALAPIQETDPTGTQVNNSLCRAACDALFGKPGERQACYAICTGFSGPKNCSAFKRYCQHLCQGHGGDQQGNCKICKQLYGRMCDPTPGPLPVPIPVPAPLPGRREIRRCCKVAAGAFACYCLWEGLKWGAAILCAPETGGLSLGVARVTP